MKSVIFLIFSIFIIIWSYFTAFVLGLLPLPSIPGLVLPTSFSELGASYGVINGLFLSVTAALGLIAILIQGKALQHSILLQNEQTAALTFQVAQQNNANRLSALTAQLHYYHKESDRLDIHLEKLREKLVQARTEQNDIIQKELVPSIKQAQELKESYNLITKELNANIKELIELEPEVKLTAL